MATLTPSHKPYPLYKPSGIEWLGDVPTHWEVHRMKWVAELNPSRAEERACLTADTPVTFLPMERVGAEGQIDVREKVGASQVWNGYTYFRRGDILVAKITPCFENGKGAFLDSLPTEVGFGSTEFHVLRAKLSVNPQFLFRLTTETTFRQNGTEAMTGAAGQKRVPAGFVANYKVPLPPLAEQRAIAAFLDRETGKIDALISRKERLIELLQEKRTALISRAVTKGLDPDAPLKESGVEWLGEIPTHWEVKRVSRLFSIGSGTTPPTDRSEYYGGEIPWITTSELREAVVISTEKTVTEEALRAFPALNIFPEESIAVAMYGATIGRIGILGVPATVNQACCVFSEPNGMNAQFWFYWLQSRRHYLILLGHGGGQPNLSQNMLKSIRVPTPPLVEQAAIVALLDRETAKLDNLIAKVREAIERLKELRAALISAAVTGKIDVREEAGCT